MATLSEIIDTKMGIEAMLYENGGEITPEIEEALALNEGALEEKIDGYYTVIQKMAYGTEEIDKEIARLQALKKTKANAVRNMKERLLFHMNHADITSVNGVMCKAFVKKNAPSVKIEDEANLYAEHLMDYDALVSKLPEYVKLSFSIDKTKLKDVIKSGVEVCGCSLEQSQSVVFK